MNLLKTTLLFYSLLIIHNIEEYHSHFWDSYPVFDMPEFIFMFSVFAANFFVFCILVFLSPKSKTAIKLAQIFIWIMTANGIWHIVWSITHQSIMPGSYTACIILLAHAGMYIKWKKSIYRF